MISYVRNRYMSLSVTLRINCPRFIQIDLAALGQFISDSQLMYFVDNRNKIANNNINQVLSQEMFQEVK